jgi:hypothetical protein
LPYSLHCTAREQIRLCRCSCERIHYKLWIRSSAKLRTLQTHRSTDLVTVPQSYIQDLWGWGRGGHSTASETQINNDIEQLC